MRLSTRLLLPLVGTVVLVMVAYGAWAQAQRERIFLAESERETRAYATALGLAVERTLRHPELGGIQEIIDQVTREPTVYGVAVYDSQGAVVYASDVLREADPAPDSVLAPLLGSGGTRTYRRTLDGEPVVFVLRPLTGENGTIRGALEVAQPPASIATEHARIRSRFALNTLTLVVVLALLLAFLVRRLVSRPLERFAEAVRRLGEGDLAYRVDPSDAGGELALVARDLNVMAASLQHARVELVRETEDRIELERRLQQSEKMAAVGTLAASLAHEIGAPLHVIRGRADLLVSGEHETRARERNLGIIIQQIDRITLIVRNLLGYAKRREPRIGPVELTELLGGVAEFLEGEARRTDIDMSLESPEDGVTAAGDPDLLHQVFLNLILNAFAAVRGMEGGGSVGVTIETLEGWASVTVTDSGPGIPDEDHERIFDPFFTTKDAGAGTGLGLAVARGIVEDHGGELKVMESEDPGARIRVLLPLWKVDR